MLSKLKNWVGNLINKEPKNNDYLISKLNTLESDLDSTDRFSINKVSGEILEIRNKLKIVTKSQRIMEIERDYKHYYSRIAFLKKNFRGHYEEHPEERAFVGKMYGQIAKLNLEYQQLLRWIIEDTRQELSKRDFIKCLAYEKTRQISIKDHIFTE